MTKTLLTIVSSIVWRLHPPMPIAWAHQMGDQWPEHYHWEDDLVKEFNQIVARLK